MKYFMPFFFDYLDESTGEIITEFRYPNLVFYENLISMFVMVFVFFAVTFIVLHFAVSAIKWAEKIVTGNDNSSDLFGGED